MSSSPAPPAPGRRPPLVRPRRGAVVAGVARGLAVHLGQPVRGVRVVLALSVLAGGAGLLLYLWLWAFVPTAATAGGGAPVRAGAGEAEPAPVGEPEEGRRGDLLAGGLLLVAAVAVVATRQGWPVGARVVLPLLGVVAGAVLVYSQLDEVERGRWSQRGGSGRRAALRVVAGALLVAAGVLAAAVQGTDLVVLGRALLATSAVLAGVALVLAPWGVRLWRDLDAERTARAQEVARADVAAHLHDSVLQTLALVQKRSGDAAEVARLARAQERDLRAWLYGAERDPGETLAGQVSAVAAEVEDRHGVPVEVVHVGDRAAGPGAEALVAALREAVVNAARHAGAPVSVYLECGPDGVEAYVRDRGRGFDVAAVPADRLGVRTSVVGRMERAGGSAVVRSAPGAGTEVRLHLPPERAPHGATAAPELSS